MGIWMLARRGHPAFQTYAAQNNTAIDRITKWIPGDILALFAAVVTGVHAIIDPLPNWIWLIFCLVLTPIIVLLVQPTGGQPDPMKGRKAVLAFFAFLIWSFTIPESAWQRIPVIAAWSALVSGIAIGVGIVFGLIADRWVP